jgi:hypothetical protein
MDAKLMNKVFGIGTVSIGMEWWWSLVYNIICINRLPP